MLIPTAPTYTRHMTNIPAILETIYLGDRAGKSIRIDGWNSTVALELNCISRVRGPSWNFYTAEDIEGGFLVFKGVDSIAFDPPGLVPDDYFGNFRAEPSSRPGRWKVILEVGSSRGGGVEITIDAEEMCLQDSAGVEVP